ncbi:uncharacterized protein ASPGLDRAFT_42746 [Aspergillus glaucus CBS 516.65]|uniref:Uncharacterized protein n=1 Tax=Aspergillus glaucus CBS 516.65 TaxID=1160497 RepID=A0A1L9VUZ5_ASPGL|nr:hypothetical protein ASPGLDRAFT_42746 [Aspergillus glaucus CBS 516.65]OJJ87697.1 hypothetical protein ASPGLDRAFT_42746 [Aspergillus glaucus CBS 516.65]
MGLRPGGRAEAGPSPGTRALYEIELIPPFLALTGLSEKPFGEPFQYIRLPLLQPSIGKLLFLPWRSSSTRRTAARLHASVTGSE